MREQTHAKEILKKPKEGVDVSQLARKNNIDGTKQKADDLQAKGYG